MTVDLAGSCLDITTVRALQQTYGQWSRMSMFCVADGHAGFRCSEYILHNLTSVFWATVKDVLSPANSTAETDNSSPMQQGATKFAEMTLSTATQQKDELVTAILKQTILTLDEIWLARVKNSRINDGSCVLVSLLIDDRWYFAHLGDCRAICVRGNVAKNITKDHTPGVDKVETERIEKAGGKVQKRGTIMRVIAGGTKIAVTRALGDANMKRGVAPVLSSEADTTVIGADKLGAEFTLVLVSDGVTSRLTNRAIAKCLRTGRQENHPNLSQYLVERAYQNGSFDNITALIIQPNGKEKQ